MLSNGTRDFGKNGQKIARCLIFLQAKFKTSYELSKKKAGGNTYFLHARRMIGETTGSGLPGK